MSAYVVALTRFTDPSMLRECLDVAQPSVHRHGGRYLASSADVTALEGQWPVGAHLGLIAFSDVAPANSWHASAAHETAFVIRRITLERRLLIIEGGGV
jgi:uncharacterized protein (DUF1330 family)